jgi:hypothetical protein
MYGRPSESRLSPNVRREDTPIGFAGCMERLDFRWFRPERPSMQPLALSVRFFPVGCADAIASDACVPPVRCVSDDGRPRGADAPPLLCWCADVCRRKNDVCDARTHSTRSGGRKPAVVRMTRAVREEWRSVRRLSSTQPRAAGVSPPWVGKCASADTSAIRRQTADGVCADCRCIRVY